MGLLVQSDFAKFDWIKSDLRIQWPKSSDFGPKSVVRFWPKIRRQILAQNPTTRPIGLSNRKMASVFNQVKI